MKESRISYTLQTLPEEIQSVVFQQRTSDINHNIAVIHRLTSAQLQQILQIIIAVITKELPASDFKEAIATLDLPGVDLEQLMLDLVYLRLWPLREWIGGVEILLQSLGGTLPQEK